MRFIHAGLVLACSIVATACTLGMTTESPPEAARAPAWLREPAARDYVLEIGDVFDVKFFTHPELNEAGTIVRPDGKISLPLVGDVIARGRTPTELTAFLTEEYDRAGLRRPRISVLLRKSAGLRVFVGGEVRNPGLVPYDGRLTFAQALLQAGGPKSTGEVGTIVLLRDPGDKNAEPLFAVVDLDDVLKGRGDFVLQPYDIIFVPQSTIARLNQFIEQYIVKMIPVTLSAGFSYTLGTVKTPTN